MFKMETTLLVSVLLMSFPLVNAMQMMDQQMMGQQMMGMGMVNSDWSIAKEKALRGAVMGDYQKSIRPAAVTEIKVAFYITSLDYVDIKAGTWGVTGWWYLNWVDERLSWNMSSYGNIRFLMIHPSMVWVPAIVVTSSADKLSAIKSNSIPLRVDSEGNVHWRPPGILKLMCEMDSTFFPYDRQECPLEVSPFGYTMMELRLKVNTGGIRFDFYMENGEYEILSKSHAIKKIRDKEMRMDINKVSFTLTIQRMAGIYWCSILIPVMLASYLVPIVFLLPVHSGEKMGFSLTVMLSFVVILTMVSDLLSSASKTTPHLEVWVMVILFMSVFSVLFTCLSLLWFNKPEGQQPSLRLRKAAQYAEMCLFAYVRKEDEENVVNGRSRQTLTTIEYTYQELSLILDGFLLIVYLILTVFFSVVFLMVIALSPNSLTVNGDKIY